MAQERMYLSLVVPAYNEGKRIGANLRIIEAYLASLEKPYEIIVVNDGSSDNTADVARDYAGISGNVKLISYELNRGKGYAVRQGVLAARGEYIGFSDADLSAPVSEMSKLFEAMFKGYDIAVGSRAVKGSNITTHQPLYRELGGKGLNLIIRLFAVPGIHDTQCGFKLLRSKAAKEIFERCILDGWGFDIEVLYLARKLGFAVSEVPVQWGHAESSSMRALKAGIDVIKDIIRIRTHSYDLSGIWLS